MSKSLAERKKLRARRKQSLRKKVEQTRSKTSYDDPRMWSCERNKDGIGQAVIRFLEPTDNDIKYYVEKLGYAEEEVPFYVMQHQHSFKGQNGRWYINNCPTSVVERDCPVCQANSEIVEGFGGWDAVDDNHSGKKLVRNRKRKEVYYANVYIVEDKANPENEGKVKIFKYGKAIHNMIMSQLIPEFDDEEDCNVSDYWEGKNLKLRITKKDGYTNYDKSTWSDVCPVADSDEEIEAIMKQQYDLTEFISEDKYKSYDQLKKEFERTLGKKPVRESEETEDEDESFEAEVEETKPKKSSKPSTDDDDEPPFDTDSDDDDDEYFASLLDD